MNVIIISGIDGSGKTSVIDGIIHALQNKGFTCEYKWMRFNHFFVKPLHLIAKYIGLTYIVYKPERKYEFHAFYRSKLFSKIYIFLTFLDTYISSLKLKKIIKNNSVQYLICDRWIIDTLVDLKSKTKKHYNSYWDNKFFNILPNDCKQFVIIRNKENILNTRLENIADPDFYEKFDSYFYYSSLPGINLIENDSTIDIAIKKALSIVISNN